MQASGFRDPCLMSDCGSADPPGHLGCTETVGDVIMYTHLSDDRPI